MGAAREGRAGGFENGIVQPLGRKRGRFPGRHAHSIAIGSSAEGLNLVGWATFLERRFSRLGNQFPEDDRHSNRKSETI